MEDDNDTPTREKIAGPWVLARFHNGEPVAIVGGTSDGVQWSTVDGKEGFADSFYEAQKVVDEALTGDSWALT